jgi:NADPH2 dehydrogenase
MTSFPAMATLKTPEAFRAHLAAGAIELPFDNVVQTGAAAPLSQPWVRTRGTIGNRFCILPMEGWDGTTDGRPTELTHRRWRNFGLSGAKLIFGGEAVAVRHDGRANPNQLVINESTVGGIASLREGLVVAHRQSFGANADADLLVGLQLTFSGRFSRPNSSTTPEPRTAYCHPYLDAKVGATSASVLDDDDMKRLIDDYIAAARLAAQAGYAFVDLKHCHGYFGHELLSAVDRPGPYGGSFDNRTRFLRDVVSGIRAAAPNLELAVRVSIFDFTPFRPGEGRIGEPTGRHSAIDQYRHAFGGDGTGDGIDFTEPSAFCTLLEELGIELVCTTAGSPYYNPHIQRPAAFPPSDGYLPPEDPLVGVARQIAATAELKRRHPRLAVIGSAYSYLQEWLPNVGQRVLRDGGADFIGLGRMVLSYPDMPADILAGRTLVRKKICRTFSDCTTAPRNGIVSGCFPLDPFYKAMPHRQQLHVIKGQMKSPEAETLSD